MKVFTVLNEYSKYLMSTLELGHFDEHFIKITRKRDYARKHFEVFSPGNLTQRWTQSGPSFQKSGHFLQFSKTAGEVSPLLPSCAPVSVALNMPKYPWKCLNKCSDYARALNMHNHLTCSTGFWRCQGF